MGRQAEFLAQFSNLFNQFNPTMSDEARKASLALLEVLAEEEKKPEPEPEPEAPETEEGDTPE